MSKYDRKNLSSAPWSKELAKSAPWTKELAKPAPWSQALTKRAAQEAEASSKPTLAELLQYRLFLGHDVATGEMVTIHPSELATHMHVMGSTNKGKSFFLEGLIETLICQGHGVCLIDPHGSLYKRVLDFCTWAHFEYPDSNIAQRVIPFDVAEKRHFLGFNPMARSASTISDQADAVAEAFLKTWGQDSAQQTPRLARWLPNAIYAIIEAGLTLVQVKYLLDPLPNPQREAIIQRVPNPDIKRQWEFIEKSSVGVRDDKLESTYNRLWKFVTHEIIRRILGQRKRALDFNSLLAKRKILLVNLARQNVISDGAQKMLGTLLINEILAAAFAREAGKGPPFFVFIDEFARFVVKDIRETLDEGRKFGLHLILAHQHLSQLAEQDPLVYHSTLTCAQTKCVFGGLEEKDLDVVVREMFTGEFDPNLRKLEIYHTVFEPKETTRVVRSYNESRSTGEGKGHFTHDSFSSGMYIPGSDDPLAPPMPVSTSEMHGFGTGESTTFSESHTSGHSYSEVPFHEYIKTRELSSVTFKSLEEQVYEKKALLKRLLKQYCAIRLPEGQNVRILKAGTLNDFGNLVTESQRQEFLEAASTHAGCFSTREEFEREQQEMEQLLLPAEPLVIETESVEETQRPTKKEAKGGAGKRKPRGKAQPPKQPPQPKSESTPWSNVQFDPNNPSDQTEGE